MENTLEMLESSEIKCISVKSDEIKRTIEKCKIWYKNDEEKLQQIDNIVSSITVWSNDFVKLSEDMYKIEYMKVMNQKPIQQQINDVYNFSVLLVFSIKEQTDDFKENYSGILEESDVENILKQLTETEKYISRFLDICSE